jgi:hypothetical protein
MRLIPSLNPELLEILERYRSWVFQDEIQRAIRRRLDAGDDSRIRRLPDATAACSVEALAKVDPSRHSGYPESWYGLDLNYQTVQNDAAMYEAAFFDGIREMNRWMDAELQTRLGARYCALKAYYPAGGYIPWHTNWNVPGYTIILTYSPTGNGFWRHIDPKGATGVVPNPQQLVHLDDARGWHGKAGYFGGKDEADRLVWHCAYTAEPRVTLSYVIPDRRLWEDLLAEMASA